MFRLHHYPLAYCIAGILLSLLPAVRAQWLGFFLLSALIVVYGICVYKLPDIDNQDKGENCYVIGFVYTLVVITLTLIFDADKFIGATGAGGDLGSLFTTIGVGLGTSVVGMMGRSFYVHTLVSKKEDEYQMHVRRTATAAGQMATEVERLSSSFGKAAAELANYAQKVKQESDNVSSTLTQAFANALESINELITQFVARSQFENLYNQLDRSLQSNDEIVNALRANTGALENAISNLKVTADSTQKFIERAGEVLDPQQLQQLQLAIGALGDSFNKLADMPPQLLKQLHSDLPEITLLRQQISSHYSQTIKDAQENERKLLALLISAAETVNQSLVDGNANDKQQASGDK